MHRLQQIKGANGGCAAGMETGSMPSMSGLYRSCSSDSSSSSGGGDCEEEVCRLGDGLQRATSAGSNSSSSSSSSGSYPRVWEFTCIASVHDAVQMLQDSKRNSMHVVRIGSTSSSSSSSNDDLNPACLETAVRCAANCSSRGRSTPMHTAAERGCAQHVQVLLQAGAAAAARDTSGASPLFVAAEAGRAAAVEALLCAGADPLVGNTAGETALYIAGRGSGGSSVAERKRVALRNAALLLYNSYLVGYLQKLFWAPCSFTGMIRQLSIRQQCSLRVLF
jgi:hypothetical protein